MFLRERTEAMVAARKEEVNISLPSHLKQVNWKRFYLTEDEILELPTQPNPSKMFSDLRSRDYVKQLNNSP